MGRFKDDEGNREEEKRRWAWRGGREGGCGESPATGTWPRQRGQPVLQAGESSEHWDQWALVQDVKKNGNPHPCGTKGGHRPPTCPFPVVAGGDTNPCLQRAHPWPLSGRTRFETNPCGCWTSPPHPTPWRADEGGKGVLYPHTLQKKMPPRGFSGPSLGEAMLHWGLCTGPATQILLPKAAGSPWQG